MSRYKGPLKLVYFVDQVAFPPTHKDAQSGREQAAGWDVGDDSQYSFVRDADGDVTITHKPTGFTTVVERVAVKSWTAMGANVVVAVPVPVEPPPAVVAAAETLRETPMAKAETTIGNRTFGVDAE
jgi:hypothetical protein